MNMQAMLLMNQKKKTSHLLHLVLTILTVGFWSPIWILVALSNAIENSRLDSKVKKLIESETN